MAKYLISFEKGAMDHIAEEDFPEFGRASLAVISEAIAASVYVTGGGLSYDNADTDHAVASNDDVPAPDTVGGYGVEHAIVATNGTVTDRPSLAGRELIGGLTIIDVPTREEALTWAAKIAAACRCPQDVRKFMPTPNLN